MPNDSILVQTIKQKTQPKSKWDTLINPPEKLDVPNIGVVKTVRPDLTKKVPDEIELDPDADVPATGVEEFVGGMARPTKTKPSTRWDKFFQK